ncbi:cyclic nucleotide-binding-like protein [Sporodiniella umbellata]|nr:cyclic nucleotide-binding-like protein [Sporodiniella umbellata]
MSLNQTNTYSEEYNELIQQLTERINSLKPDDIVHFCYDFFQSRLHEDKSAKGHMCIHPSDDGLQGSGVAPTGQTLIAEDEEEEEEELSELHDLPKFKSHMQNRRVSVSAESMQPQKLSRSHKKIPKSKAEQEMIHGSLIAHFLFKTIEEEQRQEVIQIMEQKEFSTGSKVIEQGATGDYFYIVSSGTLDCLIQDKKIVSYERGGSFGELALMYNAPRAATIVATSDITLWALDRISFRSVIMESNALKRTMHESFLREVPLFKSLEMAEIHKIADALEPIRFQDGHVVLKQGDPGDSFYLIEEGNAVFYLAGPNNSQQKVNAMQKGDYFGDTQK